MSDKHSSSVDPEHLTNKSSKQNVHIDDCSCKCGGSGTCEKDGSVKSTNNTDSNNEIKQINSNQEFKSLTISSHGPSPDASCVELQQNVFGRVQCLLYIAKNSDSCQTMADVRDLPH